MVRGRLEYEWTHTSSVMALIANVNRDPKKSRAFRPADFNPYAAAEKRDKAMKLDDMGALKGAFVKRENREPRIASRDSSKSG